MNAAITLTDVHVRYEVPTERINTLKEHVIRRMMGRKVDRREFYALRGINLTLRRGEALGVIGRNGAGKSTLLKVISRVLPPTEGRVRIIGSIAPLIELGAGFHPELTGRENVYMNGAMLGYSQAEMGTKFNRIVDFAGLWEFIDAPLRVYSSGMMMRLAFAIATDVDPDILVIDEILAVGDAAFQERSRQRIREFIEKGTTILFVSHDIDAVTTVCSRGIWLENGQICADGPIHDVAAIYYQNVQA